MPEFMPSLTPLSLRAACPLAFSFFAIASTSSPTNETRILQEPGYPLCFPPPSSPRLQPLSQHDCRHALGVFLRNLPFGYPTLTHDPDKAHLPDYVLAPAIEMYGDCMFGADIPPGRDALIDLDALVYRAHVLMAACVGKAEHDGGISRVEVPESGAWIDIDFQYWVSLANVTKDGFGNITDGSGLILNSSTAAALPALSAFPDSAMVAKRWTG